MRVWRIVRERRASTAFDGEGAARSGQRWNSRGVRVVYTAESLALAALEVLVHSNPSELVASFVAVSAEIPEALTRRELRDSDLPPDWRNYPAPPHLRALGDAWAKALESAVLEVPSVVIPSESNFLLNPAHEGFARIRINPPVPFTFDPRLGSAR